MSALTAGEDYGADCLPLILDEIAGKGHHFSLSTPNSGDTHHFGWNCCARVNATGSTSLSTVSHGLPPPRHNRQQLFSNYNTTYDLTSHCQDSTSTMTCRCVTLDSLVAHHSLEKVHTDPPVGKQMDFHHWRATNLIANVTTALHNLPWNVNTVVLFLWLVKTQYLFVWLVFLQTLNGLLEYR